MQSSPASPVTGGYSELVDQFDVQTLVERYRCEWHMDVSGYFNGAGTLKLFRCQDTGYRFFHPPVLAGEAELYDEMWEANEPDLIVREDMAFALDQLEPGERVLDVGCSYGLFVGMAQERGAVASGIDGSAEGCKLAQSRGLDVTCAEVCEYAAEHRGQFDVVTALAVLEHVYDVAGFVGSLVELTRPGGRIFISVPNADPYWAGWSKYEPGNNPPHHVGYWNEASLRGLAKKFGLAVHDIQCLGEPDSFKLRSFRRAAYLSNMRRPIGHLRPDDWLRVALAAPLAIALTAVEFVKRPNSRKAYIGIVMEKQAAPTDSSHR